MNKRERFIAINKVCDLLNTCQTAEEQHELFFALLDAVASYAAHSDEPSAMLTTISDYLQMRMRNAQDNKQAVH